VFNQAVAAGATTKMPVMDMFWGDRYGQVKDPFGYTWSVATHTADLSPEEMEKGAKEAMAAMASQHQQKKTA
jgi:PhnB protein